MAYRDHPHDPVSVKEFQNAFLSLWKAIGRKHAFTRLGFAISGGVDSMALAYLWSQLRSSQPGYYPIVKGFVIDHGLRPGSAQEAQVVASRLKPLLGRRGEVITLDWKGHGGVEAVTSIETTARQLRFQALGRAARWHKIQCILMGHHADDMAETALFRLANGSQGTGLLGLKPIGNIPECDGRFGTHSSGSFRRQARDRMQCHYVGGPEEGGLKIGRPLLEFSKSRLIATCKNAGIRWTEDSTNEDVKLTQRNAIRAMMKSDVLPKALRPTSLQGLLKDIKDIAEARSGLVDKLYAATEIDSLDLRGGVLRVHLPSSSTVADLLSQYSDSSIVFEAFSTLLHSLVQCISSTDIRLEVLKPISAILFKETTTEPQNKPTTSLSVGQIIIERIKVVKLDGKNRIGLRMYRAPFSSYGNSPEDIILQPQGQTQAENLSSSSKQVYLWDARWWMKIENYSSVPLRIKPLDERKLQAFRKALPAYLQNSYNALLSQAVPGSSRWTIPAIVCDELTMPQGTILPDHRIQKSHSERTRQRDLLQGPVDENISSKPADSYVVAIPTMNIFLNEYWKSKLKYDIRYKHIPLTNMISTSTYTMAKPIMKDSIEKDTGNALSWPTFPQPKSTTHRYITARTPQHRYIAARIPQHRYIAAWIPQHRYITAKTPQCRYVPTSQRGNHDSGD